MQKIIEWTLPFKTISEANSKEHWSKKSIRHRNQKKYIYFSFRNDKPKINLPCRVKMTRCSSRKLDSDNLQMAFKWVRDAISEAIFPGSLPGRADDDPNIIWEYDQEKSKVHSTKIELFSD